MKKPDLTKTCPLCGGPMQWCGDVPTDVGTSEEMASHTCDQITCTACQFNVEFHGIASDDAPADDEIAFSRHLQQVADKWNGGAA